MDTVWNYLETRELAMYIGESWWFPLLESIHVLAATFLVGTIAMLDLRLLGVAATNHTVSRLAREILPWTLLSAGVAVATGIPLFTTRATHYAHNVAFQAKMLLLLAALANMLFFHLRTERSIDAWDAARTPVTAARLAGLCSMVVWTGVILSGRWIGHLID
jgi:hypothetical protein